MSTGKAGYLVLGLILLIVGLTCLCTWGAMLDEEMATPTPIRLLPRPL